MHGVVPITVKAGLRQKQRFHVGVKNLDAEGILTPVERGLHGQTGGRADVAMSWTTVSWSTKGRPR